MNGQSVFGVGVFGQQALEQRETVKVAIGAKELPAYSVVLQAWLLKASQRSGITATLQARDDHTKLCGALIKLAEPCRTK